MAGLSSTVLLSDEFVTSRRLCKDVKSSPTTPIEKRSQSYNRQVWADPRSLATTKGVAIAFYSSGYLDVSVPRVGPIAGTWA